jgi:hypothetical protein
MRMTLTAKTAEELNNKVAAYFRSYPATKWGTDIEAMGETSPGRWLASITRNNEPRKDK